MRVAVVFLAGAASALTDIEHKPFMRKNIDPIISPGKYVSHMHSFYGSDSVTKDLPTTEELQKGCPSGENPNDLSIYCRNLTRNVFVSCMGGYPGYLYNSPTDMLR